LKKRSPKQKTELAIDKYKKFHQKDSAKITFDRIDLPEKKDKLIFVGKIPEIKYISDKWGRRPTLYRHTLKKHGNILAKLNDQGRVSTIIISGLNINITKEGLLG